MANNELRQLGNGFAVRTDSVRTLMSRRDDPLVRLCSGGSKNGRETLFFVEDEDMRWLLAVEESETSAGLERLNHALPWVLAAIASDDCADPESRDFVIKTLQELPESVACA